LNGNDLIQVGAAGNAGVSIDFSGAATSGGKGFSNIDGLSFANTSGTSTATFNSAQFGGAGKLNNAFAVTGTAATNAVIVNMPATGSIDRSGWTFTNWTNGTDSTTLGGSTGSETIVGSSQADTFIVTGTAEVGSGDTYDGGAGIDVIQIGTSGAGTSIDLSG